jgi:hypothetical protein
MICDECWFGESVNDCHDRLGRMWTDTILASSFELFRFFPGNDKQDSSQQGIACITWDMSQ